MRENSVITVKRNVNKKGLNITAAITINNKVTDLYGMLD